MPFEPVAGREPAHHLAVVILPEDAERDSVRSGLADRGIQTSVHYPPIHRFTAYRSRPQRPLPQTDSVAERLLTLPLYGGLTDEQVDAVVEGVLQTL